MSSAILYLAIVGIWAFMLVPRWLRRSHAVPLADEDAPGDAEQAAEYAAEALSDSSRPAEAPAEVDQPEPDTAPIPAVSDPPPAPVGAPDSHSAPARASVPSAARPAGPSRPPLSRAKVLQARRRLLTTLILLAVAAASCTALKLTSGWVCVPPAGMLGMYLLLLREAALADAENARWRAEQAHAARQRAQEQQDGRSGPAARTPEPTAQVIDISARLGDQLYDQYADATMRAVGD